MNRSNPEYFLGKYELLCELGRGARHIVYKARDTESRKFVSLKVLPNSKHNELSMQDDRVIDFRKQFYRQASILHPSLIRVFEIETAQDHWSEREVLFMTMEFFEGDEFLDYVRPEGVLDGKRLRHSLQQLIKVLLAIHQEGLVHLYLKSRKILIGQSGKLVLLDHGSGCQIGSRPETKFMGRFFYGSLERFDIAYQAEASADWYSLGALMFNALSGESPFGNGMEAARKLLNEEAPRLEECEWIQAGIVDLTNQLLAQDPLDRPDGHSIAKVLGIDYC